MTYLEANSIRTKNRSLALFINRLMWIIFLLFAGLLGYSFFEPTTWHVEGVIAVDHLSVVVATAVLLFTCIILSYSSRYMAGSKKLPRFMVNCIVFAISVIGMVVADHMLLFVLFWLAMGLLMAELIGGYTNYEEGKASRRNAGRYFLLSSFLLAVGLSMVGGQAGSWVISEVIRSDLQTGNLVFRSGMFLIFTAAFIQSAIFPFQRWLMSSMTAPTPASALMHAGFVNAGAILLARLAPLVHASNFFWMLVLGGGIGALVGKFGKFVQSNYKQKLACSTTAQMGFMLLQCGLGYFAAAVTHLILHGFYKAYLFLSAGDSIEQKSMSRGTNHEWKLWYLPMTLISGVIGGVIFAYTTGKGLSVDSGLFLNFVIVLTVIHGTLNLINNSQLSRISRLVALPVLIVPALLVYALMYNGIVSLLSQVPMTEVARPVSWDQLLMGAIYFIFFIIIEFELYRTSRRLYVYLLNISQPKSTTILQ